jgi:hypothetical protein
VKKYLMLVILLMIAGLAGCSSSPDYKIDFTKPLYFGQDKASPFEIKVTENKKSVKGLKVKVEMSMANMDHGTYNATLTEGKSGTYTGKIKLPMAGKYEANFTLEKGGKTTEKTIDLTVKKPAGVALIDGKWITNEDIDFYKFINYLQLAINREAAQKQYSGKKLDEEMAYLKSQEKTAEDKNQILTQIIRLRAMGLIAKEKGYTASDAEVNKELSKVRGQYKEFKSAEAMIKAFGEKKFWDIEKQQYTLIVLTQKVQQALIAQAQKENPKAGIQEVTYEAQQKYEDLLVSQVSSLKIEIL